VTRHTHTRAQPPPAAHATTLTQSPALVSSTEPRVVASPPTGAVPPDSRSPVVSEKNNNMATVEGSTVLVTGGAGYIGSHTCLQLLAAGCKVVVVDNLDNSSEESLRRVKELIPDKADNLSFHDCDILDREGLDKAFAAQKVDAVIHFAGLKAVGESVAQPMKYYSNNIVGTVVLVEVMEKHGYVPSPGTLRSVTGWLQCLIFSCPRRFDFPLIVPARVH
jgi:hypothetical protein